MKIRALAALTAAVFACGGEKKERAPDPEPSPVEAAKPNEHTALVNRDGNPLTVIGDPPEVGDTMPAFTLVTTDIDGAVGTGKPVESSEFAGKYLVLSVVPSIDTPVCEAQTGQIAQRQPRLPENVAVLTVSRDLPFAQKRFLSDNVFETRLASDSRDGAFGRDWGLVVKENGLLARSLWLIDPDGKIAYREIVANQKTEPDYAALEAALEAAGLALAPAVDPLADP